MRINGIKFDIPVFRTWRGMSVRSHRYFDSKSKAVKAVKMLRDKGYYAYKKTFKAKNKSFYIVYRSTKKRKK